ncbi:unnamed protein product [Closterium sp. NIES-53]
MDRPESFPGEFPPNTVWKLNRPVYGLKQAPREWHNKVKEVLLSLDFHPSSADPTLFIRRHSEPFYILVYMDDFILVAKDSAQMTSVQAALSKALQMKDLGDRKHYLGMEITRDRQARTISLSQEFYIDNVLKRFEMELCTPVATPLLLQHLLTAPVVPTPEACSEPYPELVGSLMYAMMCTRPDLAYPVSVLSRYVAPGRFTDLHWKAAKRVLRYLQGTKSHVLTLGGLSPPRLEGYTDSSWADDQTDRRSSQGYCFTLGSGIISWHSTRSSAVSLSSCEAELYAGTMAAQEARWLTFLLQELGFPQSAPPSEEEGTGWSAADSVGSAKERATVHGCRGGGSQEGVGEGLIKGEWDENSFVAVIFGEARGGEQERGGERGGKGDGEEGERQGDGGERGGGQRDGREEGAGSREEEWLPCAPIGDSDDMELADWVISVGNPVGLPGSISLGAISSLHRTAAQQPAPHCRSGEIVVGEWGNGKEQIYTGLRGAVSAWASLAACTALVLRSQLLLRSAPSSGDNSGGTALLHLTAVPHCRTALLHRTAAPHCCSGRGNGVPCSSLHHFQTDCAINPGSPPPSTPPPPLSLPLLLPLPPFFPFPPPLLSHQVGVPHSSLRCFEPTVPSTRRAFLHSLLLPHSHSLEFPLPFSPPIPPGGSVQLLAAILPNRLCHQPGELSSLHSLLSPLLPLPLLSPPLSPPTRWVGVSHSSLHFFQTDCAINPGSFFTLPPSPPTLTPSSFLSPFPTPPIRWECHTPRCTSSKQTVPSTREAQAVPS